MCPASSWDRFLIFTGIKRNLQNMIEINHSQVQTGMSRYSHIMNLISELVVVNIFFSNDLGKSEK